MKIDVYLDTICPWCWVGKRNLEKALELWDGEDIEITYKPFFLDPTIPESGIPSKGRLQEKYGMSDQQLKVYLNRLFALGLESGVKFEYDKITITPNTIASHILIKMVPEIEQPRVIEKIFFEYFNQGKNIGDLNVLKNIAAEFKINEKTLENALKDKDKREQVVRDVYIARYRGITGVPFYIINDKYSIYGAQKPDIIIQALNNVVFKENSIKLL